MPNCHLGQVAAGGFCEADGECGTDVDLNNCPGTNWIIDLYQVMSFTTHPPSSPPYTPPLPPPPPSPPVPLMTYYVGCYNTTSRGALGWDSKGVQSSSSSLTTYQALCAGWQYLSIECPGSHGIHVSCANNLGSGHQVNDTECIDNAVVTGFQCDASDLRTVFYSNFDHDGCTGPYSFSGGIPAGGCHRGAVYLVV